MRAFIAELSQLSLVGRWEMYAAPRTCHALWTHGSRVRPAEQGGGGAHQQVRQTWTRLAFCDTWAVASRRRRGIRARLEVHHLPRRKRETPGTRSRAASTWCVPARVAMGCIHPCSRDPRVCAPQGARELRQRVAAREARAGRGAHVSIRPLLRRPARAVSGTVPILLKSTIYYHKAPLAISRGGRSEALGRSLCVIRVGIHQW